MVSEFDAETVEVVVGDDNGVIVFVTVDEILEPTESVLNRDSVVTAESEKLPVTDADAVIEFDADGDDEGVVQHATCDVIASQAKFQIVV